MKLNISAGKIVEKLYQRSCIIVILTDPSNAVSKMLDKMSFHKHFKYALIVFIFLGFIYSQFV